MPLPLPSPHPPSHGCLCPATEGLHWMDWGAGQGDCQWQGLLATAPWNLCRPLAPAWGCLHALPGPSDPTQVGAASGPAPMRRISGSPPHPTEAHCPPTRVTQGPKQHPRHAPLSVACDTHVCTLYVCVCVGSPMTMAPWAVIHGTHPKAGSVGATSQRKVIQSWMAFDRRPSD